MTTNNAIFLPLQKKAFDVMNQVATALTALVACGEPQTWVISCSKRIIKNMNKDSSGFAMNEKKKIFW